MILNSVNPNPNRTERDVSIEKFINLAFAGLAMAEQEVAINWMRGDEYAEITTSDPTMLTKLQRVAQKSPELIRVKMVNYINDRECGATVVVPRKLVSIRSSLSQGREMTDEQREAARERLALARARRDSGVIAGDDDDSDFDDED